MTVLALVGPTASGKSMLALQIARARVASGRPTELVAVDAFTVYRGMDVGTAKPAAGERAEVPHHLIDVLEPWQELTVAAFQHTARAVVDDVLARGATPLLVGGSGLYFRAVVDDLRFPPTDPVVRSTIERRWDGDPVGAHTLLTRLDPEAATAIAPENLRRTVRALEVIELTGERFSRFDDAWRRFASRYATLQVGYLEPDGAMLRARIHERARGMVDGGLLDEASRLRSLSRPLSRTAAKAIGYQEAFAVLDGDLDEEQLAARIAVRTWRYAKRQRGWFRADPRCEPTAPHELLDRLRTA